MLDNEHYEERAKWDAARQIEEVRVMFSSHAAAGLIARHIDNVYRPALETMEARANDYLDTTQMQAKRIAALEDEIRVLRSEAVELRKAVADGRWGLIP